MHILVTGFEPFGDSTINPSEQVVRWLGDQSFPGLRLTTAILPVDLERGPTTLLELAQEHEPEAVLCLGEAARRAVITVERVAINLLDFSIPDNAGNYVKDGKIASDGPAAYFTTLPHHAMIQAMRDARVPADHSLSAGAYLCNQVTYVFLHSLARRGLIVPAGFIHLPLLPEQALGRSLPVPSMGLDLMTRGVAAALGAIAATSR